MWPRAIVEKILSVKMSVPKVNFRDFLIFLMVVTGKIRDLYYMLRMLFSRLNG